MDSIVRDFSDGYYIVENANVIPFKTDSAVATGEFVNLMTRHANDPVLKVGGQHYRPSVEHAVPADTLAIPYSEPEPEDNEPLLLMKGGNGVFEQMMKNVAGGA